MAEVVEDGAYRGVTCTLIALSGLGDAAAAASCRWPDECSFVVGSVLDGSAVLLISLASNERTADELLADVSTLLTTELARLP